MDVKKSVIPPKKAEPVKAEKGRQRKIKAERPKPEKTKTARPNRAKLLVSIVNRSDERKLKTILDDVSVALSLSFEGTGTAHSTILDYFGIGETEKTIALSLFPESDEEVLIRQIRTEMALYLVGRGISFTVPLTGVSQIVANGLAKASAKKVVMENMIMTDQKRTYDLIVCAVNSERSDEAMEAARSAGAAGGTIMHARMLDNKKAEQFIGISLATEQEILLILTKREGKHAIMQALFDRVGVKTDAGGIIFSVPVDRTVGIGADEVGDANDTAATEPAQGQSAISESAVTAAVPNEAALADDAAEAEPTKEDEESEPAADE